MIAFPLPHNSSPPHITSLSLSSSSFATSIPARPSYILLYITDSRGALRFLSTITMAERYIPEHRRTQFKAKNQFKPDELRRRREEQQVEIRKQKREDNLAKRRGIQTRDGGIGVGGMNAATESDDEASAIESEVGLRDFLYF